MIPCARRRGCVVSVLTAVHRALYVLLQAGAERVILLSDTSISCRFKYLADLCPSGLARLWECACM